MISHLPPLLADFASALASLPIVAIVSIVGSFCVGPLIIFIVFRSIQRRHELWHETARIALEKGQPLPPMPADVAAPEPSTKAPNDIRSGLILIAVGGGLFIFLNTLIGRAFGYIGAIPGFIGVALLLYGIFTAAANRRNPPSAQP